MDYLINRLSSLRGHDREWLLGQLTDDERTIIVSLLEPSSESDTYGDRPRPSAKREDQVTHDSSPARHNDGCIAKINAMNTGDISSLFDGEDPQGVALMLSVHPWHWTERYLFSLPHERVRHLKDMSARFAPTARVPAIHDAVIQHICDRTSIPVEQSTTTTNVFDRVLDGMSAGPSSDVSVGAQ